MQSSCFTVVQRHLVFFVLLALVASCKLPPHIAGADSAGVAAWFAGPGLALCRQLVEANKVDVPTLVEMTDEEMAAAFANKDAGGGVPISPSPQDEDEDAAVHNSGLLCVEAVQRVARRLRSGCQCNQPIVDFWSALREENWRTWVHGALLLFTPRVGWGYAYFFDATLLTTILDTAVIPSSIVAWAMIIVCPDLYFAINALPFLGPNYVLVVFAVQHYVVQCFEEVTIALLLIGSYRTGESIFEPGTSLFGKVTAILPWWLLLPAAALVTSWMQIPLLLQQLAVMAFLVQGVYVTKSLLFSYFGDRTEPSS